MSEPGTSDKQAREARIGQILNDFLDRKARGEPVSETQTLSAHPDLADELRQHFEMLRDLPPAGHNIDGLIAKGMLRPSADPRYPAELGPYKITDFVGRGGMGVVLKAYEESLNRTVALKTLRPELAGDATALQRFVREAKAAAALRHPNIVTVYTVGEEHGVHFLSMEYIDGPSLAELIREGGPMAGETIRQIFRQLLDGLACAHKAGLIHRDIKSSNILLDGPEGRVKITDFGLARMITAQTRLTLSDSVLGTAEYMSPEQARGDEKIDQRTDLYSAGVVLYEMLTGRTPFRAETPAAVIHRILHEQPADPRSISDHADPHLASLALRLMAKQPEDRFSSATEAADALDADKRVRSLAARRKTRRRVWAGLSVFLLVVGAVWLVGSLAAPPPRITEVRFDPDIQTRIQARYGDDANWKPFHPFPREAGRVSGVERIDVNGAGQLLVVAGTHRSVDGHCVFAFNPHGERIWHLDLSSKRQWPDCEPPSEFGCCCLANADLDGEPGDELIVVASDVYQYPTYVAIIDPRKPEVRSRFWHLGDIAQILVRPDFFGPGRLAIIARGVNNKLDGFETPLDKDPDPLVRYDYVSVVMILDAWELTGEHLLVPPVSAHRIDIPSVLPHAYALLDLSPNPDAPDVSKGLEKRRWPEPTEVAAVRKLYIESCPNAVGENCVGLLIHRDRGQGGTMMIVDGNLEPRSIMPLLSETVGRTEDYWRQHWHVIVQDGRYVDE